VLATYRKDGSALVTPVWFRFHDDAFEVVIAKGDVKLAHLARDPQCILVVFEAVPPFRGLEVRGAAELVEMDVTPVRAAIASRYLGSSAGEAFAAERTSKPGVLLRLSAEPRTWSLAAMLPRFEDDAGGRTDKMNGYTKTNLQQVENQAPNFGMPDGLEARFGRSAIGGKRLGVSVFKLHPGFRVPFGHKHGDQEEVYVIVRGSARVKVDDEIVELGEWDAIRFDTDTMRDVEAGPDGVEYIAFGAGTDPRDAEMVQNWWNE